MNLRKVCQYWHYPTLLKPRGLSNTWKTNRWKSGSSSFRANACWPEAPCVSVCVHGWALFFFKAFGVSFLHTSAVPFSHPQIVRRLPSRVTYCLQWNLTGSDGRSCCKIFQFLLVLRQVSTNSLAHSPMVHKKLSLVRGELAHQFCQNLSFPLSMMQKFWLSERDTDLLYGSGVCRFRQTDKGNGNVSSQITPSWLCDGSELPGVCAGRRPWISAEDTWPCAVFSAPMSARPLSFWVFTTYADDRSANPPVLPQIPTR